MRVQWEIMLFIICLNLSIGAVIALEVPGTEYVKAAYNGMTIDEYETNFNATELAIGWQSSPFSGIPMVGDIFAGFNFLWQNIAYLVDGFPALLNYLDYTFITTEEGHLAFLIIQMILRALYAILVSMFVIEFISGRVHTD